jgi:hypothetical protein
VRVAPRPCGFESAGQRSFPSRIVCRRPSVRQKSRSMLPSGPEFLQAPLPTMLCRSNCAQFSLTCTSLNEADVGNRFSPCLFLRPFEHSRLDIDGNYLTVSHRFAIGTATRPGPQPISSTFMPGSRSRFSTMTAARQVFAKGLSTSTSQLNHAGQGSDLRRDAKRHMTKTTRKSPNRLRKILMVFTPDSPSQG